MFSIMVTGCSGSEPLAAGGAAGGSTVPERDVPAAGSEPIAAGHGACIRDGECVVRKVAEGLPGVSPIAYSDGLVWAVGNKSVVRVDASGTKVFETDSPPGFGVAAIGGFVFWDFDDDLLVLDPRGKVHGLSTSRCDGDSPLDLNVHDAHLYYRCGDSVYALDAHAIDIENVRTTAARNTSYIAGIGRYPHALTVDTDGTLYWADRRHTGSGPLELMKRGRSDETVAKVDDTYRTPALVATPTHLVFADYQRKSVVAIPKNGGAAAPVAEGQEDTYQMTSDASGVYWASRQGIMRAELDGSGARLLAKVDFASFVGKVALSPESIYWTSPGDGTIYAMGK